MISPDAHRQFAVEVVRRLTKGGFTAYWAGGCVRDLVRGETPQDYDVATDATPDGVRDVFGHRRTLAVGESFGVIIVRGPAGLPPVEVATFRAEGPYKDGRRPESVVFCTAEEDARRRDFTINGMFYDPLKEELHDFVEGRADLERRLIRAIGDPAKRMQEDKLRLLRAARFAGVLDFEVEEQTARAVREMSQEVLVVSVERITQELKKMLLHPRRKRCIALCRDLGLMAAVIPEWMATPGADAALEILHRLPDPSFALTIAALLRELPGGVATSRSSVPVEGSLQVICRRLKLSNQDSDDALWLHAREDELEGAPSMLKAELKPLLAHRLFNDLLKLATAIAEVTGRDAAGISFARQRAAEWSMSEINPPPLLDGHDLMSLGVPQGPRLKALLASVREAQLNDEIRTPDEARELARRMHEEMQ
jgi:poly(A) polymerase